MCLITIGLNGEQLSTELTSISYYDPYAWTAEEPAQLFLGALHARSEKVYLGCGTTVHVLGGSKSCEEVKFRRPVLSLVGSAPHTRTRVAAVFREGGEVFWDDFEDISSQPFADGMPEPIACFNRGGYLIAACEGGCEVYSTQDRQVRLVAETKLSGPRPLAVLRGPRTDQFGIVAAEGEIRVYEISGQ